MNLSARFVSLLIASSLLLGCATDRPAPIAGTTLSPATPGSQSPRTTDPSPPTPAPAVPQPDVRVVNPTQHTALILPLAAKAFASVAESVKQGFLAGATADTANPAAHRVYTIENEGEALAAAYQQAVREGASVVIAGMTRDGATQLTKLQTLVPTLALNIPASTSNLSYQFYFVSLAADAEARQIARIARADGGQRATIIAAPDPLSRRIQESFEQEWKQRGGDIAGRIPYAGDATEANQLKEKIEKTQPDLLFLATRASSARLARPYLPVTIPIYATSQINDARAGPLAYVDLDDVRIIDMPWFVQEDHPAVMAYAKPAAALSIEQERLYALGIDAWRLAKLITSNHLGKLSLDGITGQLTLRDHEFTRTLPAIQFRDGKILQLGP